MSIVSCSNCGKGIDILEKYAGRRVKCPGCGGAIDVPELEKEYEPETQESIWTDELLNPPEPPAIIELESPPSHVIQAHPPLPEEPKPPEPTLLGSFIYPFKGKGKYTFLALLVFLVGVGLVSMIPVVGIFAFLIELILPWYFFACLAKIVSSSAAGEAEMPDWPDITDLWDDVVQPALLVLWTLVVSFIPVGVYCLVYIDSLNAEDPGLWWCIVFGCFYFPMALLAVVVCDCWWALHPFRVVPAIIKVFFYYLFTSFLLIVVVGLFFSLIRWEISVPYLNFVLTIYLVIVAMRIIGIIYHKKQTKLGWF